MFQIIRQQMILLALLLVLTIALAACVTPPTPTAIPTATPTAVLPTATPTLILPTPTPTKPPPPQDWQSRWLKKIPCSAPCFEGITPGKTTASEAIDLLNQNSLVKNVEDHPKYNPQKKLGFISWDWAGSRGGGTAGYSTDTGIIYDIIPGFGVLALSDVTQAYGEPTHIIAVAYIPASEQIVLCQRVSLVYVSYGLELYNENCHTKIELDENLSFPIITFFVPDAPYQVVSNTGRSHPDWMLLWQGFKGFDYYCRDEFNGKLCRGELPK